MFPTNVLIKACDTDVLTIMLANIDHLQNDSLKIFMEYGTGNAKRYINITKLYIELGQSLCASLPGFHALTGCDYNPFFFQKGKIRPLKILMKNKKYQTALTNLGVADITGLRNEIFEIVVKFVCEIYGFKNITNTNILFAELCCASLNIYNMLDPFHL